MNIIIKTKTNKHNRNVHLLLHDDTVSPFAADSDIYVNNLSNITISRFQKEILSLRVKFYIPTAFSDPILVNSHFEVLNDHGTESGSNSDHAAMGFSATLVDLAFQYHQMSSHK